LEAAVKGKKIRSYTSLSSAKVFGKWDKGLCEWCDEIYFPGHKCKKMGPKYLFIVVAEEEDTMQYNFCSGNQSLVDAPKCSMKVPRGIYTLIQMTGLVKVKENCQMVLRLYFMSNWMV